MPPPTALPDYETLCDHLVPLNRELQQADAATRVAQKEVSVNRQGWLPHLQVGYRRNTAPTEEFNGFVVGGSIPLFANKGKVKAARARALSAELQREDVAMNVEAALQALYNEARQVEEAMRTYDLPLMHRSFDLLGKALHGGELSWHQYFVELEALVRQGQAYLRLENRYHKVLARIYADRL